jgi:hypothetical protein
MNCLAVYSRLMVVAGLIRAAFCAWKLSVIKEISITMKPESKNSQGVMFAFGFPDPNLLVSSFCHKRG